MVRSAYYRVNVNRKRPVGNAPHGASTLELPDELTRLRQDNLGRELLATFEAFEARIRRHLIEQGWIDALPAVYVATLRSLDLPGTRMGELARRVGVSKQYIGSIVGELVTRGIVRVDVDPLDSRARIVRYTPEGLKGLEAGLHAIQETTAELERALGKGALTRLRRALARLRKTLGQDHG